MKHQVIASHGLGNQLFQLTFAHFLRLQSGVSVSFENSPIVSKLEHGKSAKFQLSALKNSCDHLDFRELRVISNYSLAGRFSFRSGLANYISARRTRESEFSKWIETRPNSFLFLPELAEEKRPTSFRGFWQHWRYLHSVEKCIYGELKVLMSTIPSFLGADSKTKNLVVHVRRGDFKVRDRDSELGLIHLDSYRNIIREITKGSEKNIKVWTITDDYESLVGEGVDKQFGTVLTPKHLKAWQSLKLMSEADFLVSSNSTFSWWGAFLAHSQGAETLIPKPFYRLLKTYDAFLLPGHKTYEPVFQ